MPRPHRPFLRYCRCFSHRSPCRQGRCILSKKPSDSQLRGYQRRRRNRRHCPVWSARRAAGRRCSPPAHDFCSPSRTHTAAHCAGWRPSGRRGRNPGRFWGGFPWRTCFCKGFRVVLLTFHNDKRTDHSFFREASPPGCRSGQREVQTAEKLVVKHGGALGCEQRDILNDLLSVDSGQPLSGWFSLKSILPKRGSAFYTI
mgnify:CR=1 FL=1